MMAYLLQDPKKTKVADLKASDIQGRSGSTATPAIPPMMLTTKKGFLRFCCTNMVEPRLIDVRSKSGDDVFFDTVWFCPTCHRVSC